MLNRFICEFDKLTSSDTFTTLKIMDGVPLVIFPARLLQKISSSEFALAEESNDNELLNQENEIFESNYDTIYFFNLQN